MGAVLRFIAWVIANIGRWGRAVAGQVGRITAWARNNWRRVLEWINAGISFATIVDYILRILGIG
ncbi:aureocin A53 family class IId bacteriocin [Microbacterium sp. CnD16-F]|uniref:Uncharacterized protein n=2 Tax=Microbacterium TaxID=33882 RepID=A0A177K648_9MICO|nr:MULTISPECIES: aureocin A53 family class IId bacteriocin [Microbacterium]MCO7203994.1 aureocin A53 family class IId bacteriocin [Microbacterium sp. CnD16-F]MDQ1126257.1 hypothetical protein [Microbacterium sp. SORGH_AS_0505]MDT3329679.1 aureocin A53 family class IId bacteriocin [Microbacterium sp. KSW-18]MDT3345514.1 aureocin A53 family class IId bacteriocin [Microbacterium sp. KSW2-22]OAH48843.1 hypothetical protein AYL44_12495 [Microbacterium oleivorans]